MPSQQLETILQILKARPPSKGLSIKEKRESFERETALFLPVPPGVRRQPVDAGGVRAEWIAAPGAADDRVILYLHGGSYQKGSTNTHAALVARLSQAADARVLAVDYRLAPEHPHPAAVEDTTTAYRWLLRSGVPPARVVIAGDSAGGGLTVATLVALRDGGDSLPAAGVCLSPWVDMEGLGESMTTNAGRDPLITGGREGLLEEGRAYLGGADPRTPLAAPLYADLARLPPLLIQVGTAEILLDDSTRLAERTRSAGVEVTLELWDDMIHGWHAFAALLPEGQQAIDRVGEFIRKHTG